MYANDIDEVWAMLDRDRVAHEIRKLARMLIQHNGYALEQLLRALGEPDATVKHLLYAYRVLLTGIHMMRTGLVVSNLRVLNDEFGLAVIDELIERKRAGAEKMPLEAGEMPAHDDLLDRLERQLVDAHAASSLPEQATTLDALDDLLVRVRLAAGIT